MPVYMANDVREVLGVMADKCESRSLAADKFCEMKENDRDTVARARTLSKIVKPCDSNNFSRVRHLAFAKGNNGVSFAGKLAARLIINQAGGVVENAGLCLDRHTGEPYIPGSALKGIAALGARMLDAPPEEFAVVFGFAPRDDFSKTHIPILIEQHPRLKSQKNLAGTIAFLPAYPLDNAKLELDILTCHHPKYYADVMSDAFDTEQPNPQTFPVVQPGAVFVFTLAFIRQRQLESAKLTFDLPADFNPISKAVEWLKTGISEHGIGAKTAAGYGWFDISDGIQQEHQNHLAEEKAKKQKEEIATREKAEAERQRQAEATAAAEKKARDAEEREKLHGMNKGQVMACFSMPDRFLKLEESKKLDLIDILQNKMPELWQEIKEGAADKKKAKRKRYNPIFVEINRLVNAKKLDKMP